MADIPGLDALLIALNAGETIPGGSPHHKAMHAASQESLRITAELNGHYHSPDEVRALMSELTGREVPESFRLFPPFGADFGKNIRFGEDVFVNSGCRFQDQGGIEIGDGSLIGHNAVITTLNHDLSPSRRADMHPARVVIGSGVWFGANVTVLPGPDHRRWSSRRRRGGRDQGRACWGHRCRSAGQAGRHRSERLTPSVQAFPVRRRASMNSVGVMLSPRVIS